MTATAPTTPGAMASVVLFVEDGEGEDENEDAFGEPAEAGDDVVLDLAFAVVAVVESLFSALVVVPTVFDAGSAVNPLSVQ